MGRWERWHEIKVVVPEGVALDGATLEVTMRLRMLGASPPEAWACNGRIGMRRSWPEDVSYASAQG